METKTLNGHKERLQNAHDALAAERGNLLLASLEGGDPKAAKRLAEIRAEARAVAEQLDELAEAEKLRQQRDAALDAAARLERARVAVRAAKAACDERIAVAGELDKLWRELRRVADRHFDAMEKSRAAIGAAQSAAVAALGVPCPQAPSDPDAFDRATVAIAARAALLPAMFNVSAAENVIVSYEQYEAAERTGCIFRAAAEERVAAQLASLPVLEQ